GSNALLSCLCPAVRWMATMKPQPSLTKWIFVPNPPRERPNAWSEGSCICAVLGPPSRGWLRGFFFRPGCRPAGPDDGGIDTPEVVVDLAWVVQFVQQRGDDPDPGVVRHRWKTLKTVSQGP